MVYTRIIWILIVCFMSISHADQNYEFPSQRYVKPAFIYPLTLTQSAVMTPKTINKLCTLSSFKDDMQPEVTIINSTNTETEYIQILFTIASQRHTRKSTSSFYYAGNFHIDPASSITVKPHHIESKISKFSHPVSVYPSALHILIGNTFAHLDLKPSGQTMFMIVKDGGTYTIKPASICSNTKH